MSQVEDGGGECNKLEKVDCERSIFGIRKSVQVSVVGSRDCLSHCAWVKIASIEPRKQFIQFHIGQWSVAWGFKVK